MQRLKTPSIIFNTEPQAESHMIVHEDGKGSIVNESPLMTENDATQCLEFLFAGYVDKGYTPLWIEVRKCFVVFIHHVNHYKNAESCIILKVVERCKIWT